MLEHLPQASLERFIEDRVDAAMEAVFASPEGEALRKKAIRYSRMLLDEGSELQCMLFFEYEDTENQAKLLHFKECYRLGVQDAARLMRGAQKAFEKKEDVRMDSKALQVFSFEKKDVRVVMRGTEPWVGPIAGFVLHNLIPGPNGKINAMHGDPALPRPPDNR